MQKATALKKYFTVLVNQKFTEKFGNAKGTILSDKFNLRFNQLFQAEHNQKFLTSNKMKKITLNPLFLIAFQYALQKESISRDQFELLVNSIFSEIIAINFRNFGTFLEAEDQSWDSIKKLLQELVEEYYEKNRFKLKVTQNDRLRYGFNIENCLYLEVFETNNASDLASFMCNYFHIITENFHKNLQFQLNNTIFLGGSECRFRFFKNL